MKLIERYIFRRIAISLVGTLAAITAIVWIVQGLNRLNIATDSGATMISFLYVATLLIPSVIPLILPFALLLAAIQVFRTMNTDSEMAVIKASGGRKRLIVKPVIILALIAGSLTFLLENAVTPYSRQEFRVFVAEVRANLLTSLLQEGTFQTIDTGVTVHVAERLPNGGFGGLFISDRREADSDLSYFATEAAIVEDDDGNQLLFMRDGELHQKDVESGAVSIVRFNSYAFDLSAFAPAAEAYIIYPKDQTTAYLLDPDPDNPRFQQSPMQFTAEFHKRMTSWTLPLIFGLIAILMAGEVRTPRQVNFAVTGNAMALGTAYFLIVYTTQDMAATSLLGLASLYLLPLVVGGVIVFMLATDRTPALPARVRAWFEPVSRLAERARARTLAAVIRNGRESGTAA